MMVKNRYSLTNVVNKNYYQTINVSSDISIIRKRKIYQILGFRKTKEYIGPNVVFVSYIMVQNLDSNTLKLIQRRYRKEKLNKIFNE